MATNVMVCTSLFCLLTTIFVVATENLNKKSEKKSIFECGFDPISSKKMAFTTNFLMMMMMFLIFDVEVSILIPFVLMNKNNIFMVSVVSSMFISLLAMITLKEWKQGSLQWSK